MNAVISLIHETNTIQNAWFSSITAVLKGECINNIPAVPYSDLIAARQEDPAIVSVLHLIRIRKRPEPATARYFLYEWHKLFIGEDGIRYGKPGSRDQMVLPKKYHKRTYEELYENMGHLGAKRAVELAIQNVSIGHL